MKYKEKYSGIIFDCDGVVFDSNKLKVEAFRETLASYPRDIVEKFLIYHVKNAGVSRYIKFREFIVTFLGAPFYEQDFNMLLEKYGKICEVLYQNAPLTPDAYLVLKELSSKVPLYIASGSDESELRKVFKQRGLADFFVKIFGSPKNKSQCVFEALTDMASGNILMVGDAESDWNAARDANISFIYMSRFSENSNDMNELSRKHGFCKVDTLKQLTEYFYFKR